ncbi:MAG TPA: ATP synthase F1 subunit gamma [Vicinamibacterales bacterium]|jgi:F-type H+-transporting ATPase subunit gamma|nr:ATP synthase F1 subunit gamma [Vicinamibacterales bacterium]
MPSLIDLRRRVRAVKNTQQITKAMKMVAASKLRRAQERIMNARPYALQMQRVLSSVAARVDPSIHPLLTVRPATDASRTLVIVVTGDKGLCGSFNTNVIKSAATYVAGSSRPCELGLVGRKGREFFSRRGFAVAFEQVGIFQKLRFEDAQAIAQFAIEAFTSGTADKVMLVYNEFRSVISQRVVVDQLLPIFREEVESEAPSTGAVPAAGYASVDYLYEPAPQEIFNQLLPRFVEVQVYRALLESNAAFFAAQMTAMDTATKNSAEMIGSLTLYMNKVRQAAITREIIEVVSGAEAL